MPEPMRDAVQLHGMEIEILTQGEGPLVVCLHGFPDQPRTWTPLMSKLAANGFRAVAPALRGYTPAAKAPDGNYREWATASDALELISALGYEHAAIIGHDWGAAAAYTAAALAPERIKHLVTLAVPYGPAFGRAMLFDGDQQRRSWYWFFLQLPFAEAAVAHEDFAFIARLWREWSPGFELPAAQMQELKQRLAVPGVLPEILAYYRQALGAGPAPPGEIAARLKQPITVPTLYLHGRNDGCIGADLGAAMAPFFTGSLQRRVIDGVGHFLHAEQPDLIGAEILAFLRAQA
ncbi:alpha/beta fold hydrolase [Peristeroidobacter soli]|uniref:alpha/beta fold hydrolase n=1 Tax=Peristeroidobacter soli TaxID=2497877 RepID=UPI0013007DFE|nr:alpha/beta hydrolase [Peristeroidobacter soli]